MNEVEIHITVDDSDVDPSLAALKGKFARAFADFPTLSLFDFKTGQIDSHLSMIKTKLQAHGIADLLDVNLNPGQIDAQLLNLKRKIQQHKLSDFLDVNLDVGQAESQMLALMEELGNFSVSIPVSLDIDKSALAALHSLQGITVGVGTGGFRDDCCTSIVNAINQNADMVSHDLAGVQDILAAGFQRVTNAIHDNGDLISHDLQALVAMGRGGGGGGSSAAAAAGGAAGGGGGGFGFRGWGWLFAGTSFAGIAAWHIAFDALLETFIAVTGAAAALAAGIAATIPTFDQLGIHMKAINTVNSAFGDQINVSGGAFRNFAESSGVANRALEMFGGGVSIVQKNTGGLIDVADKVLTLLDDWVAKIDLWANSQGGLNKFLHDGIGYLEQFGQIFGNIGVGIGHLFSYMPGVAHYLGDILVVGSKIFALITDVPRPIGEIVLGLHGMYIWGRVAVGAMLALGGRLGIVSANARQAYRDMTVLSAVRNPAFLPVAMLAAATGALIFMIGEAGHAQNSIQHLFGTMEENLGTLPASEALIQLANDITTLQQKEKSLSLANVDKLFGPTDFSSASIAGGFQKIGFALESAWGHLVNAITSPAHGGDLTKTLADVGDAFKSIFTSAGADSTAAVRDLQGFNQEIDKMVGSGRNLFAEAGKLMLAGHNFSDAFGIMNLAGVKWNDTAAVMQQKVNNLLTSYKEMSVQGGILRNSVQAVDFATLQQDSAVTKLTQGWTAFFGTLISGENGFVGFAQNMDTLDTQLKKVNGSLTGLGKNQLTARSDFLQAAQGAQTEMNNLTTMAASANLGAKGTNMLSQASKDMVASLLPAAKGSKALTAILYGLAQQGGYRGADSFRALSHWADNVKNPMKNLDKITTGLTVDMGNLLQDVKNLSVALGTTLTQAAAKAIFFASGGQKVFNAVAMSLIHDGANTRQFHDSLVPLASQLLITTGNTAKAHAMFDSFLMMMGENRSEADKLWASVVRLAKGISGLHDKSFTIFESGQGHYQIYGGTRPGATGGGAPGIPAAAKGLYISRGSHSKADDVLMWGSKGELMVPEEMVKAGLVDHLRGRIPGFSTGGYVGGISGLPGFTDRMTTSFQNQFTDAMINAMKKASVISFAAGGPGGGLPSRNAALAMAMFHPSPAEWSAWNYVAMAESGWNQFATNPSSGAYGIPQALPFTKMPPAAWPLWAGGASNPAAQIAWMWNYMWDAWGGPIGAAAHEAAYHWYGDGVDAIFKKRTLIGVGERGDEHVTVTPVGRDHGQRVVLEFAPGAHGSFEAFMAEIIRKYVRVRGGNVQNVFGR